MITLSHVRKAYRFSGRESLVLRDIDFRLPERGLVAIVGDSGSGKTTLLNILGGLDRDYEGEVLFDGRDLKSLDEKERNVYRNRNVGFVFQDFVLVDELTVEENILLPCGSKRKEAKAELPQLLMSVGLEGFERRLAKNLSGGEKQRVAILRALVNKPRMILADEPTGALDKNNSRQIASILKDVSKTRLVVMVTHNDALAKEFSDLIIKIEDGVAVQDGAILTDSVATSDFDKAPLHVGLLQLLKIAATFLFSHRLKTLLASLGTAFSIFGLSLIMAVYSGFGTYIGDLEGQLLKQIPLVIEDFALPSIGLANFGGDENYVENDGFVSVDDSLNNLYVANDIDDAFIEHLENMDPSLYDDLKMRNGISFHLVGESQKTASLLTFSQSRESFLDATFSHTSTLRELPSFTDEIEEQYDLLEGEYPTGENDLVLVLGKDNSASSISLTSLGLDDFAIRDGETVLDFDRILSQEWTLIPNEDFYKDITDPYNPIEKTGVFLKRQYDLVNDSLRLGDFLSIGLPDDVDDITKEEAEKLLEFVEIPETAIDIDTVDFSDEDSIEDFFLSLFQTKRLSLFREMNEAEKRSYCNEGRGRTIRISGILKAKEDSFLPSLRGGLYYTSAFADAVERENSPSFVDENGDGKITADEDHRTPIAKAFEDHFYVSYDGLFHPTYCSILDSPTETEDVQDYFSERELYGTENRVSSISIYPKSFQDKERILSYIGEFNAERRKQGKGDIVVTDLPETIFSNLEMVLDIVFLVLVLFTGISLLVAVILVSTILYSHVTERTREIGLFRAVGFSKMSVFGLFAIASLLIGLLGGFLGLVLCYIVSAFVNIGASSLFPTYGLGSLASLPFPIALLVLVFALLLSFLSAIAPSLFAARKDPVRSLRD